MKKLQWYSTLPVAYKLMTNILLNWINRYHKNIIGDHHGGFRRGWRTIDHSPETGPKTLEIILVCAHLICRFQRRLWFGGPKLALEDHDWAGKLVMLTKTNDSNAESWFKVKYRKPFQQCSNWFVLANGLQLSNGKGNKNMDGCTLEWIIKFLDTQII